MWLDEVIETLQAFKEKFSPNGTFIDKVEPIPWTHYIRIVCGNDSEYYDFSTKEFLKKEVDD